MGSGGLQHMEMMNIYTKQGLKGVINASGRMTKLGVSTINDEVAKALVDAAQSYVVIDDLLRWAGKKVGSLVGCADACLTSSASAGIALSVSSLICKDNLQMAEHFQETIRKVSKRQVILLKGHSINFGAPVSTMVELGGGEIVEVGYANSSNLNDIRSAVNEDTLAIVFVKSHHCVQKNMVGIKEVVKSANEIKIPCIIDAAAEEDLSTYMNMGADFVCYSGAKAICGPTSGFVACRSEEYANNMRLQYSGIGRAMKIGKENIMGLVKAVEMYQTQKLAGIVGVDDLNNFLVKVNQIEGLSCSIVRDEAGRPIYRAKIDFDKVKYGMNAKEVAQALSNRNPAIYTRDYQANIGSLSIDPRPLNSKEELAEIYESLVQLKKEGFNE
jgi:uncharacterized pyridoxal phosphate-dependent enzyme